MKGKEPPNNLVSLDWHRKNKDRKKTSDPQLDYLLNVISDMQYDLEEYKRITRKLVRLIASLGKE